MKLKFHSPVAGISGSNSNGDLVFQQVGNRTFAKARSAPANPNTPEQQAIRDIIRLSSREWQTLTPAQRVAWEKYHAAHYPGVRTNGISMFNKAAVAIGMLGLPPFHAAPKAPPPTPVTSFTLQASAQTESLTLKIKHRITSVANYALLIRTTPPMPSVARKPRLCDYRYVNGVGPASTHPLLATGQTISIPTIRTPIPPGKRFGIELRILRTTDGITSPPITTDFIR